MADYFLVKRTHGPSWDPSRGPVGEGDGTHALLVMDVGSEAEVRERLAADPWGEDMLTTESIEPWSIFLRRERG